MGRALHVKLKEIYEAWATIHDDASLLASVSVLADQFGKERQTSKNSKNLKRDDLHLICYEYLSA
jgi:hypothetical protein